MDPLFNNIIITGQIKVINQELIIASNGPIMIFIPKENIDIKYWDILDRIKNINNNKKLSIDDYIKIQIIDNRINQPGQKRAIGKLLDFASPQELLFVSSEEVKRVININIYPNIRDDQFTELLEYIYIKILRFKLEQLRLERQIIKNEEYPEPVRLWNEAEIICKKRMVEKLRILSKERLENDKLLKEIEINLKNKQLNKYEIMKLTSSVKSISQNINEIDNKILQLSE
jgi:hypothetical protein